MSSCGLSYSSQVLELQGSKLRSFPPLPAFCAHSCLSAVTRFMLFTHSFPFKLASFRFGPPVSLKQSFDCFAHLSCSTVFFRLQRVSVSRAHFQVLMRFTIEFAMYALIAPNPCIEISKSSIRQSEWLEKSLNANFKTVLLCRLRDSRAPESFSVTCVVS